jgi:hypothetical protein
LIVVLSSTQTEKERSYLPRLVPDSSIAVGWVNRKHFKCRSSKKACQTSLVVSENTHVCI